VPHLVFSDKALSGLKRCIKFLALSNVLVSKQAQKRIKQNLEQLTKFPEIGRPYKKDPVLRELIIDFSGSGYIALYKIDLAKSTILILEFRHQKEVGY
jgi:plasmid stabilization system protein ParE